MLPTAKIGPYTLPNPLIVAPMAGVTDRPFRQLCRRMGAGLAVSEMVIADSKLWHTRKSPDSPEPSGRTGTPVCSDCRWRSGHAGRCGAAECRLRGPDH